MENYFFFGLFSKILNNKPLIKAPYKVLFTGLEVILQVPDSQPT
jgi:hypothetical protein